MNYYQYFKAKVGMGGWLLPKMVGGTKIYGWRSRWADVNYYFVEAGIWRIQVKGSHPMYPARKLHKKGEFKWRHLKCQLLAQNDEIYHNPDWWREAVDDYTYGRMWSKPQYGLVEKYINKEV